MRTADDVEAELDDQEASQRQVDRLANIKYHLTAPRGNKKEAIAELSKLVLEQKNIITHLGQKEIYVYDNGVYRGNGERTLGHFMEVELCLGDFLTNHYVREVLGHIERRTMREAEEDPAFICLENGILKLDDLTIHPHTPDLFFLSKLPARYDPGIGCPAIMKFLSEVVPEDQIPVVQELAGYCLYKRHQIHKAFMLVGSGANGKSTLINLLKSFLGQENCSAEPLHVLESHKFATASLKGKLANLFADLPARALVQTGIFKMLTGEDQVPAENKFKSRFHFKNYAKMIFSCNQIPRSPDSTDAFFRRWIIIVFPNQFITNADSTLINKLTTPDELSGFLNFALEGLKRLLENGEFSATKSVDSIREQYIRMSDSVASFVMDCIMAEPEATVPKKALYTAYCDYCREQECPAEAENTFHKRLQHEVRVIDIRPQVVDEAGNRQRIQCWKGIRLCAEEETNVDNPDMSDAPGQRTLADVSPVNDVRVHWHNTIEELERHFVKLERENKEGTVERAHLFEAAATIERELAEKIVAKRLQEGDWFEPRPGHLRRV